ncbi:hypothetical protein R6L23_32820, partial [Streptomyces sp. SR27]|nr:hypothetical protein [Streptomyces sp. SR27]
MYAPRRDRQPTGSAGLAESSPSEAAPALGIDLLGGDRTGPEPVLVPYVPRGVASCRQGRLRARPEGAPAGGGPDRAGPSPYGEDILFVFDAAADCR